MPLVFRKLQNTPLSNIQLDGNFEYLRDQLLLKVSDDAVTADYVSDRLNTPALLSTNPNVYQTTLQLAQTNAINAWLLRDVAPSTTVPEGASKTSVVIRTIDGAINATVFIGDLDGNAGSATTAESADSALSLANTYTVPLERGGTNANTAAGARASLEVLHTGGTNQMAARLILNPSSSTASLGFGQGTTPTNLNNGDMWSTSAGMFYHTNGSTKQIAPIQSPTFTGAPKAPDANGTASQIATISHLSSEVSALNDSIALKANIASPALTGTPTTTTADRTSNNTRIASTAHVHSVVNHSAGELTTAYELYTINAVGDLSDAVDNLLELKASLNSPALTGTPQSTTPDRGNNSTRIATTAYTIDAISVLEASITAALTSLTDLVNQTRPVPTGSVFYLATSTVPNGYLEANGSAVSRVTYASLWQALGSPNTGNGSTTFNLPDLRGEFIRGWDHGRGVDADRTLGSSQASENLAHNHGMPGDDQLGWYGNGYGGWTNTSRGGFPYDARSSYGGGAQIYNTTTDGGLESRPRNVALMPIIKW